MDSKITIVGAGLAGLATIDTLLVGGVSPSDIILIYEGVDPWNRNEVYGFGGNTWRNGIVLTKDIHRLTGVQHLSEQQISDKLTQAEEMVRKYTADQTIVGAEAELQLPEEAVKSFIENIWINLRRSGVSQTSEAVCRPITQITNYILYDQREADGVQEQQYTKLVLAAGNSGYPITHGLGEYAASAAETQGGILTPSTLKINSDHTLCNMENIYVVGSILGYQCPMSSIIQGIVAGESIIKNI